MDHDEIMIISVELGHVALYRQTPTAEGYTHDWRVYVKGRDDHDMTEYVEKIIFHLHESFKKPIRVYKEPPYEVKESGYGGFDIKIEVIFKKICEVKKVEFIYELFLPSAGLPPIKNKRLEMIKFRNPTSELRSILQRNGGTLKLTDSQQLHISQSNTKVSSLPSSFPSHAPHVASVGKDHSEKTIKDDRNLSASHKDKKMKRKHSRERDRSSSTSSSSPRELISPFIKNVEIPSKHISSKIQMSEKEKERQRIEQSLFSAEERIPSKMQRMDGTVNEKSGKSKMKDEQRSLEKEQRSVEKEQRSLEKEKKKEKKEERLQSSSEKYSKHSEDVNGGVKRDGSLSHKHKDTSSSSSSRKNNEWEKPPKVNVDTGGRQSISKTPESVSGGGGSHRSSSKSSDVKHHSSSSSSKSNDNTKLHSVGSSKTSSKPHDRSSSAGKIHAPSVGQKDIKPTEQHQSEKKPSHHHSSSKDSQMEKKSSQSHSSSSKSNSGVTSVSVSQKSSSSKDVHHRSESGNKQLQATSKSSSSGRSETGAKSIPGSENSKTTKHVAPSGSVRSTQDSSDSHRDLHSDNSSSSRASPATSSEMGDIEPPVLSHPGSGSKTNVAVDYSSLLDDMKSDSDDVELEDSQVTSPDPVVAALPHFDSPFKERHKSKSNHEKLGNSKEKTSRSGDDKLTERVEKMVDRPEKSVSGGKSEKREHNQSSRVDESSTVAVKSESVKKSISPRPPFSQIAKSHNGSSSEKEKQKSTSFHSSPTKHDASKLSRTSSPSKPKHSTAESAKRDSSSSSSPSSVNDAVKKMPKIDYNQKQPNITAPGKTIASDKTRDRIASSSLSISPANHEDVNVPSDVLSSSPSTSDVHDGVSPSFDTKNFVGEVAMEEETGEFEGDDRAQNGETLDVLIQLQEQLMTMTDRDLLQEVVDVIEQTGKFEVSMENFEFDLCCLDAATLQRIKQCLAS